MKIIIENTKPSIKQTGIFGIQMTDEDSLGMGKFNLISSSDNNSHEDCGNEGAQKNDKFKKCSWDYFPRGKITYNPSNRTHTITLNPIISTAKVIQKVKDKFDLTGEVKITKDNSGEFDSLGFDKKE